MPSKNTPTSEIYDAYGHEYIERRLSEAVLFNDYIEAPVVKRIAEEGGDLAGKQCLDIGCGPGVYARWLLKKKAHVFGIDSSSLMLNATIRTCAPHTTEVNAKFVPGTFESYDFGSKKFSLILATFMLGYFSDLKYIFSKMESLLEKNGRIVVSGLHPLRMSAVMQMHDAYLVRDYLCDGIYYADFLGNGSIIPLHKHTFDEIFEAASTCGLETTHLVEPHVSSSCRFNDQSKVKFFAKNPSIVIAAFRRANR